MTDNQTEGLSAENRALLDLVFGQQDWDDLTGGPDGEWKFSDGELSALLNAARTTPPGMVLVPEEPDEAMVQAVDRTGCLDNAQNGSLADTVAIILREMIGARPQSQGGA